MTKTMCKLAQLGWGRLCKLGTGICRQCITKLSEIEETWKSIKLQLTVLPTENSESSQNSDVYGAEEETSSAKDRDQMLLRYGPLPKLEPESFMQKSEGQCHLILDSQTTMWSSQNTDMTNISSWSVTKGVNDLEKLYNAVHLISNGTVSPLRSRLSSSLDDVKGRTIRYYKRKAVETIDLILEGIAPTQGAKLKRVLFTDDDVSLQVADQSEIVDNVNDIVRLYENSKDSNTRCQILSVIVNRYSKSKLLQFFPGMTKYQIDMARKHAFIYGPGGKAETKETAHIFRQKMDKTKMVHAVEFFSDPSYTQLVSYGTKEMTLDSGEVVTIPNVIRTVMNSTLINLYKNYCTETDFSPLSDSSLFSVLKACAASKRTCLKGVDNIAEDGSVAYESVIALVPKLHKTQEWNENVVMKLKNSKIYLKTDYKLHIQKEDECAFHCQTWALSDPKTAFFKTTCEHTHSKLCERCALLDDVITCINKAIQDCPPEEQVSFQQDFDLSIQQIKDWRSHIIRTVNQDDARQDILASLKKTQILVVMDWAMKFLPQMYREKMTDWFGQKGIHWHVTVCIYVDEHGELKHRTYTHLLDQVRQDNFAVISLLEHVLLSVKKQMPAIEEAFIRSDNAGCYHCGHMWFAVNGISERTGITTLRYDYSEAQSGKSYCDAKIAHMRGKMRVYAAEGHNIQSAEAMKEAIDSNGGVCGVQTSVVDIDTSKQTLISHSLKRVTKFTNVEFSSEGIRFWQAYNIGKGYLIKPDEITKICKQDQNETGVVIVQDFGDSSLKPGTIHKKVQQEPQPSTCSNITPNENESESENHSENAMEESSNIFYCTENGCIKYYQSYHRLQEHLYFGRHEYQLVKESSFDQVKKLWANKCDQISNRAHVQMQSDSNTNAGVKCEPMGWALKRERRIVRFSQKVKTYLTDVFTKGSESGRKVNPATVAIEMRTLCENGQKKFLPSEWLQQSQIASFFSRLALNKRQGKKKEKANKDNYDDDLEAVLNLLDNENVFESVSREIDE